MSAATAIARNTAVKAGGESLAKVASLGFYVVMARTLGKGGFGDYMFALSLAVLLTTFAGFGTEGLLTRSISRDRDAVHALFFNAIAVKVVFGIVLSSVAVAITVVGGYSLAVRATVGLVALGTVGELLSKTIGATFLAHDDLRPVALGVLVQRFSTAFVGIGRATRRGGNRRRRGDLPRRGDARARLREPRARAPRHTATAGDLRKPGPLTRH